MVSVSQPMVNPESLDRWFPIERQRSYITALQERGGLTRLRAEYFVKLWAYLLLKSQQERGESLDQPLTRLYPMTEMIPCTHREAAELFYGQQEKGSDRAAGMMLDRLIGLGLLEKRFDGQTLCLRIRDLPELIFTEQSESLESVQLYPDAFNPRTDVIPVANLFIKNYTEILRDVSAAAAARKTAKCLRNWSQNYSACMRVLRRSDNLNPVGISIFYPVSSESEDSFFLPPSRNFFLTADTDVDPFKMAAPGDLDCTSVFIRAWIIDTPYMQGQHIYSFLKDAQQTLAQMQNDFPNLCDLYSLVVSPSCEELRQALGFQKTHQESQRSYYRAYLALDHFLALDIKQALSTLKPKTARAE